ncbi:hypothetical protein [Lysinibacillus sp. CTST325]
MGQQDVGHSVVATGRSVLRLSSSISAGVWIFVAVPTLSLLKHLLNEDKKKRSRPYKEGRKRCCFRGTTFVCQ